MNFYAGKNNALRYLAAFLSAVMLFMFIPDITLNVYASDKYVWGEVVYGFNVGSERTLDKSVTYNGKPSIKLDNSGGYDFSIVEKTYTVKPNTKYRFSAMVKYSGHKLDPKADDKNSGAAIGSYSSGGKYSNYTTSSKWKKLEYIFDTENETEVALSLVNGAYSGKCKGTAWFSDIKLEENITPSTNKWNILVVFLKEIDAKNLKINGKSYKFKRTMSADTIKETKAVVNNLKTSLKSMSGGRMEVKNIDFVTYSKPITEKAFLRTDDYWYYLDEKSAELSAALDKCIAKGGRDYDQIIAISPIWEIGSDNWFGLGGGKYNGKNRSINFCQIKLKSKNNYVFDAAEPTFKESVFVHEMLHCMESDSRLIDPEKTPNLHNYADYGYGDSELEHKRWYTAYMRAKLKGGKGLDPAVYQVYHNCKYKTVSEDMSVGGYIKAEG